jgi:hypothetical protein
MLALVIYSQIVLIPILGSILLGLVNERKRNELLLKDAIRTLNIVGVSRGNR